VYKNGVSRAVKAIKIGDEVNVKKKVVVVIILYNS